MSCIKKWSESILDKKVLFINDKINAKYLIKVEDIQVNDNSDHQASLMDIWDLDWYVTGRIFQPGNRLGKSRFGLRKNNGWRILRVGNSSVGSR